MPDVCQWAPPASAHLRDTKRNVAEMKTPEKRVPTTTWRECRLPGHDLAGASASESYLGYLSAFTELRVASHFLAANSSKTSGENGLVLRREIHLH